MSSMQFCTSCDKMMSPKVKDGDTNLYYVCDTCTNEVIASNNVVLKHEFVKNEMNLLSHIPDDISTDPTISRDMNVRCEKCGHMGVANYMPKVLLTDNNITLVHICLNYNCRHKWKSIVGEARPSNVTRQE